jgi:peptidoglycan-associated lipoprotein
MAATSLPFHHEPMKHARFLAIAFVLAALTGLIGTGCARRAQPAVAVPEPPPPVQEAPPPPPPPPPSVEPPPAPAAALTEEEVFARKSLEELNAERPLADVLFPYDDYALHDDARAVLQRNAQWLQRWPSTRVTIEGHADARGTNQYNLALGDRRGQTARDYLVSLGTESDRLLVVSRGEESPVCVEDTESCWQQNRRGHFVITAK